LPRCFRRCYAAVFSLLFCCFALANNGLFSLNVNGLAIVSAAFRFFGTAKSLLPMDGIGPESA